MPLRLALQLCTEIACSSSQLVFFGARMFTIDPKRHPPGHTPGVQRLGEGYTLSGLVSHCSFHRLPGLSFYLQSPAHRHHLCHLPPSLSFLTCLNSACITAGLSATATRERGSRGVPTGRTQRHKACAPPARRPCPGTGRGRQPGPAAPEDG